MPLVPAHKGLSTEKPIAFTMAQPQLGGAFWGSSSPFSVAMSTMAPRKQEQQPGSNRLFPSPGAIYAAINAPKAGSVVPAAAKEGGIKMYSPEYYYTCALGGIVSCGATHMAVTPLDVVKCNMQTNPTKYKSIGTGFSIVVQEQGVAGLFRGWVPTLLGYSAQVSAAAVALQQRVAAEYSSSPGLWTGLYGIVLWCLRTGLTAWLVHLLLLTASTGHVQVRPVRILQEVGGSLQSGRPSAGRA